MKPSPILISLDSNEAGSPRATALARAVGGDPAYELQGFAELPVDLRFEMSELVCYPIDRDYEGKRWREDEIVKKTVHVELKEIPDFWASKSSGHLGQQILEMVAQGQPGFVAVFGSLQEVMEGVPRMKTWEDHSGTKTPQCRSEMDIQSDMHTARAFCADAAACGVPVFFMSWDHQQSFAWILSMAKHILTGPNMATWLPKFPTEPRGYQILCSIHGIGDAAAKGLLRAYGGIAQIVNEAKCNPDALARCPVNGRVLGVNKANLITRAFCGGDARC